LLEQIKNTRRLAEKAIEEDDLKTAQDYYDQAVKLINKAIAIQIK
jgi:hypothetical protein